MNAGLPVPKACNDWEEADVVNSSISVCRVARNCLPEVDEDDAEVMDEVPTLEESKQETPKEVIKEVPQQPKEAKETDRAWYNASLYNKLMSKWTKEGDK